jgi:hypothetical protein
LKKEDTVEELSLTLKEKINDPEVYDEFYQILIELKCWPPNNSCGKYTTSG